MPNEKKKGFLQVFFDGLVTNNPVFVLMLGMCPTLAITTTGTKLMETHWYSI